MTLLLVPLRLIGVAMSIATFLFSMAIVAIFVRKKWRYKHVAVRMLSLWSGPTLWCLGVRSRAEGLQHVKSSSQALLVGNHLSYTDVLVIAANAPSCFVTSTEVRDAPGLGLICRMAGCLFVDRKNRRNLSNEVGELQEGLEKGLKVAIFPEATSTNGEQILRFRKPLYYSATRCSAPVIPFVLNYRTVNGDPISLKTRDSVFWYGDMDFIPHLLRLVRSGGVEVDIQFLPALKVTPESDAGVIAEQTQALIETVYVPVRQAPAAN